MADAADVSLVPGLSFNDEGSLVTEGAFSYWLSFMSINILTRVLVIFLVFFPTG